MDYNITKEDIIRMALEAGLAFDSEEYPDIWQTYMNAGREQLERFAALVADAEREQCLHAAEVASSLLNDPIAAIRARGETK